MTQALDLIMGSMSSLGATLEYGVVVSVDVASQRLTVHWHDADIPGIAYIGAAPAVADKVWMVRQAKSMVVLSPVAVSGGGGGGPVVPHNIEHTVSGTAPTGIPTGHVWVNPNDNSGLGAPGHIISTTPPPAPVVGDVWINPSDNTAEVV